MRKLNAEEFEFREVMKYIEEFRKPIYNSIIDEQEFFMQWDYTNKGWIRDLKESEAAVE